MVEKGAREGFILSKTSSNSASGPFGKKPLLQIHSHQEETHKRPHCPPGFPEGLRRTRHGALTQSWTLLPAFSLTCVTCLSDGGPTMGTRDPSGQEGAARLTVHIWGPVKSQARLTVHTWAPVRSGGCCPALSMSRICTFSTEATA